MYQAWQAGAEVAIGKPKSKASNRVIPLDPTIIAVLRRYRDRCRNPLSSKPVGYLLPGGWGEPLRPDSVTHLFRQLTTNPSYRPSARGDKSGRAAFPFFRFAHMPS